MTAIFHLNNLTLQEIRTECVILCKPGGLDLSRRDLDRDLDLDLDTEKKLVSTVKKISTVSKS